MSRKLIAAFACLVICCFSAFSQSVSSNDRILLPMGYMEGKLDNGLSYVMVRNGSPDRMIELRLIFRAGSVLETSGNRGAAHFLEHMAFGGTKHFPKRSMIEYLESLGIQYGDGINAYTGYDRTVYQIAVPSDKPEYLDNALLILKDWLVGIDLDPDKVENEKGIILEELRGYDVGDDFYNLKIGSGLYSLGIPLGSEDDIKRITPEILRDFHNKWYTLSQATVVVVGDIDVDDTGARIKKMFGRLKPTSSPDYREYPHIYQSGVNYAEVRDTIRRGAHLEIMIPHECTSRRVVSDAVESERNSMLLSALSRRMQATGNNVSLSNTWYLADKEHFVVSVDGANKEEVAAALENAVAELYRVDRDGFVPQEMEYARAQELSRFIIPDYSASSYYISEAIASDVMFGDRDITDPKQFEWVREQLASTLSEDLQKILVRWLFAADNCKLAAWRYNPLSSSSFSASEIDQIWKTASKKNLGKYEYVQTVRDEEEMPAEIPAFLKEKAPFDESLILSRKTYPRTGVTEVILTNGFRIVLRRTEDEDETVQVQMLAPGGLSLVPENDYPLYSGTAGYMELGGIEKMNDDDYLSMLANNGIGMIVAIENWWHGIIASAPANLHQVLFNLIREKMLSPGLNVDEFESLRQSELESYGEESYISRLMKVDYPRQMAAKIDSLMGNLMYGRRLEQTREDILALDIDKIKEFYSALFSNPSGMTCVVCGDIDVESVLRDAVSVFGSIPVIYSERNEVITSSVGESHFALPDGGICQCWDNSNETQSAFDYILYGTYEPSLRNGLILKLMQNLIRNRLLSVLREGESLVYSPYISLFYNAVPDRIFYFDISASVDRKNTAKVYELLRQIIDDLKTHKVSKSELQSIKQIFLINKRNWLQNDATANWKTHMVNELKNQESFADFEEYERILSEISTSDVREAFRNLVDTDRYMIMSLGDFKTN